MTVPIVNVDDVALQHSEAGNKFAAEHASIGKLLGARKLGYRLSIVPPGKSAWPFHAHLVNEEMVFVISGHGTLRYSDQEYPIKAGDVIALVPGADNAHQIINTSDQPIKYLGTSTMEEPEVVLYPDSGKFGVMAGSAPGADKGARTFEIFARMDAAVPYWDGEI